jgi:hypothetical protein
MILRTLDTYQSGLPPKPFVARLLRSNGLKTP